MNKPLVKRKKNCIRTFSFHELYTFAKFKERNWIRKTFFLWARFQSLKVHHAQPRCQDIGSMTLSLMIIINKLLCFIIHLVHLLFCRVSFRWMLFWWMLFCWMLFFLLFLLSVISDNCYSVECCCADKTNSWTIEEWYQESML